MRYDWLVKKDTIDWPIRVKGNSKRTSDNLLSPLEAQNRDLGTASQMLLTEVQLHLQCRLGV